MTSNIIHRQLFDWGFKMKKRVMKQVMGDGREEGVRTLHHPIGVPAAVSALT